MNYSNSSFRRTRWSVSATRASIDLVLTQEIDELRPAHVSTAAVKQIVAMIWLERPDGFWARVRWAWRLLRWTEHRAVWGGES